MRQGRKKRKKKNVLSLSTGQGRDEVCRALHRTDARAFHKNTLEYSYRTIISRFRSPTLYILLACYIVYPDFFFPLPLRVSSFEFAFVRFFFDIRDRDRSPSDSRHKPFRFDHSPLRSLIRYPIHPIFQEDILPLWIMFKRLGRGEKSEKKKVNAKVKTFIEERR